MSYGTHYIIIVLKEVFKQTILYDNSEENRNVPHTSYWIGEACKV